MPQSHTNSKPHPALAAPSQTALTVAHRGASKFARENTLAAFEQAIELGSHMIEFDVRRTQDGVLVIHHGASIHGHHLVDLGYSEIIRRYPDEQLTTLEDAINLINHRSLLDVEIKEEGLAVAVLKIIQKTYSVDEYVITSSHDSVLLEVKRVSPETCTGLILGSPVRTRSLLGHLKEDLWPWSRYKKIGADFVAVHFVLADLLIMRGARKRGVPVMIWTVNSIRRRSRLMRNRGVVAVIVNDPTQHKSS